MLYFQIVFLNHSVFEMLFFTWDITDHCIERPEVVNYMKRIICLFELLTTESNFVFW